MENTTQVKSIHFLDFYAFFNLNHQTSCTFSYQWQHFGGLPWVALFNRAK
jgi:hypothetical protein